MRRPALTLALVALALSAVHSAWVAQAAPTPGVWDTVIAWILEQQRLFHRDLAQHLRALEAEGSAAVGFTLIGVSFLYGVFHAAGPGHGKAVIATYLLTHESNLKRGILLAAASSLVQGLVAIVLVTGLVSLANGLEHDTNTAIRWSERLSFALLAGMGGLFAGRAAYDLVSRLRPAPLQAIGHRHIHGPGCGCAHGPTPRQIEGAHGLKSTLGVLLSVGLRPCSGAVLVLALANVLELTGAGIAAVAAMSVGTAITVASLAVMTVKARQWTVTLLGGRSRRRWIGPAVTLIGGLVILLLGLSLLIASFGPQHPLRL
ncbi:nickel/cobalt transporter [Magnetospirillum fulvum]|uniref:Nickel/cobalt efflux system n=1 Tax=Magnetospirillum fulvum MGU-K5 TaxID=1316936 RepID=S9TVA2_MAGFU|nr:nickel/cobalt transporter [Magnetospirillum fulvum]EPY02390.1 high-affinity nickel-transporter [Magnetospirillum fulvum MGU-K5]